ncbi:MAG: protein-disulfide reductase DsbD family protein [Hyphomicrobiales bacterium]
MRRRSFLAGVLAAGLWPVAAGAMQKPFRVSLVGDSFDGKGWLTGIRIVLDEGWKTYWRNPGESGIPPVFGWNGGSGDGLAEVLFPLPGRFHDAAGETIGYHGEVILPVRIRQGADLPQKLDLDLFFAVCRDICVPVQAKGSIELGSAMRDPDGSRLVEAWMARVPVATDLVERAEVVMEAGAPELSLTLREPVDDIFVEWDGLAYFHAPRFSADRRMARLPIANVKDVGTLRGARLRLTFDQAGKGLEQGVSLP